MILKGNSRGGAKDLAVHLMKPENDHVEVHELRGFAARTLMGALNEAYAVSRATKCKSFLYSLSINPPATEKVSTAALVDAANRVEKSLGLEGQPRAVVFHEKEGRRHAHIVWSRICADDMKAIRMSYDHTKLQGVSRDLFREHGFNMPKGLADRTKRDPRNFDLADWQQAKRHAQDAKAIKAAVQDAWAISDSTISLQHALQERGFVLAKGDRRQFVVVDRQFDTRDEQEVAGYAETIESVFAHADAMEFTENLIKQLHRDLLRHSFKDERHRGSYKTNPNNVSAFDADGNEIGIVFETATPFDTPRKMVELVDWTRAALSQGSHHPLIAIAIFKVVFLEIHPFQDGNGRLSRILTTLLLLKAGYSYVPYSSLESVIEQSKEGYYLALRQTQTTIRTDNPNWQGWLVYFLRSLQQQKRRLEAKLEREHITAASMPPLSQEILSLAKQHGRLTISDIVQFTGANRNTIKKHLQSLVATNRLAQHGKGKGTWYATF